jgi:hypothetical protein
MKLGAVIVTLGSALAAFAQSPLFNCANPPLNETSPPPFEEVRRQLETEKWRVPSSAESPELAATLRSTEKFQQNWLRDNKGKLQQVGTTRNGLEDVLLARWAVSSSQQQIRSIEMWDGAMYELVILELDPSVISPSSNLRLTSC